MKYVILVFVFSLLTGCGIAKESPDLTGYVMDRQDNNFLVVSDTPIDYSETGGVSEFYNAVWVSGSEAEVPEGEKVQVWFYEGIAESYPGHGKAKEINIVPSTMPEGADLTEAEALGLALESSHTSSFSMYAVQSITYEAKQDQWNISFIETMTRKEYEIMIDDHLS
ncbi:YobA family protein [Pontibacillus litoralis]|uniref:DUF3221 domain-containing protein n=1 Tax=Pontibacillus litoralis JSM 072002 TaxID=1385512 RepID=A0A0A5HX25_9BACI|nr:YobA family protein [Pontibacillus litoralis]KGX88187.1 hypothetical protein N784_10655 [Pontibacillus litoralis JSM 072002]